MSNFGNSSTEDALETIDAVMFTGCPSNEELDAIQEYIDRWVRRMPEMRELNKDQ